MNTQVVSMILSRLRISSSFHETLVTSPQPRQSYDPAMEMSKWLLPLASTFRSVVTRFANCCRDI